MRILLAGLCLLASVERAAACGNVLAPEGRKRYHVYFRGLRPLEYQWLRDKQLPQEPYYSRQDWRLAQFAQQARLLRKLFRGSIVPLEERRLLVPPYSGFVAAIDATDEELAFALGLPDVQGASEIAQFVPEFEYEHHP